MNTKKTEPRPPGRPKAANPRRTGVLLKFNEDEIGLIEKKAKLAGRPRAVWLRELALTA